MRLSASRYLALCLVTTLVILGGVCAINFAADPYGLYHFRTAGDWIHHRKGIPHFLYGYKAHEVQRVKPDVVILGSSRVLYGIDPRNPALPANSYNLGLEGANIYVNWRYLQDAAVAHVPQMVILGTDLQSFDWTGDLPSDFSEQRLHVTPEEKANSFAPYADVTSTLLSTTAFYYSIKALVSPTVPEFPFDNGFQADAMLKLRHMGLAENVWSANLEWLRPHVYVDRSQGGPDSQMDAFGNIITFCAKNHIRLVVFLEPLHCSTTDILTADWSQYSAWMKAVVAKMESAPGFQAELWDFTGYSNLTTEPFPLPADTYSHMQYYWECSHYQKKVGDLVLARLLTNHAPDNFGQRVTPDNLQADLDRIKAESKAWHAQGKATFIDIDKYRETDTAAQSPAR